MLISGNLKYNSLPTAYNDIFQLLEFQMKIMVFKTI